MIAAQQRTALEEKLALQRELRIRSARKNFWEFCKTKAPDFYFDDPDREYLKMACDTLQALYEKRIIRFKKGDPWTVITKKEKDELVRSKRPHQVNRKLIWDMPPQMGKSRTLVLFCQWCYGQNKSERIITGSFNDDLAHDFSRYTRDGIQEERNRPEDIIYNDIFPKIKIKKGNASYEKWALSGEFFSYKGAGIGGSITGKGGTIRIIDDSVKDAKTAYNENALNEIWTWYTGTFLSRGAGLPIDIITMTRWAKKDIVGRILDGPRADEWYVLLFEAMDADGNMLSESVLPRERYEELRDMMDPAIFEANYHQRPVDIKGRLYQNLKEYIDIPRDPRNDKPLFEKIIAYVDTADEGTDSLCAPVVGVYKGEGWLLDVLFTKEAMEITEPQTADLLVRNKVNLAKIESNNGGRGFARTVERLIWERHQTRRVQIKWFHQTENKIARILTNSTFVINHIYFPQGWDQKWPEFYRALTEYQREGKNAHDDAPDGMTGIAEMLTQKGSKDALWNM